MDRHCHSMLFFDSILKRHTANHRSFPHNEVPTHVCLKYLANNMPTDAAPIHAANIKAPCSLNNKTDLPLKLWTTAKLNAVLDASRSVCR